jgi:dTDP-4-amino-4,6-dideoxygalactose transaminase
MTQTQLPLVDLAALHDEIGDELEEAVLRVVRHQGFIGGAEVADFERAYADWTGARHAIGVANGTAAIEVVLRALAIGPGDEVIVPANTFIATAEAVSATGATPRFADVDPQTGLLDLDDAATRVTANTRMVIPVHLYGRMADMNAVVRWAGERDLLVVEDAAQAHGARRDGNVAGTVGRAGTFSFYPGKNLGAFGDAGAIVTSDDDLAARMSLLRDHGKEGRRHDLIGRNERLDALQAAVLAVKLRHIDRWNDERRRVAVLYRDKLPGDVLDWPGGDDPAAEVHHIFPVLVDDRDAALDRLGAAGIAAGIHYPLALTQTGAYAASGDSCPIAEDRAARQLSLPIHPHLSEAQVEDVVAALSRS